MRFFFLLLLLMVSKSAAAKDFPMLHYTIEDGLPSNTIYDIYQDSDGMIWIGTDKGVSRFNGIKFENFTTDDGLSDNECFFFQPDYEGRLWIGTYNGKLCYFKDGIFHNEKNTPWLHLPFAVSNTKCINLNSDSSLTLFFEDIPSILDIKNKTIKIYDSKYIWAKNTTNFRFQFAEKKEEGKYLVTYPDEKILIDFKKNIKKHTPIKKNQANHYRDFVNNKSYFLCENQIITDDKQNLKQPKEEVIKNIRIFNIIRNNKNLFISSSKGLFINDDFSLLEHLTINKTYINKNGDIWIGTAIDGLYLSSCKIYKALKYSNLPDEKVVFASKDNNRLLLANAKRSIYSFDLQNSRLEKLFELNSLNSNEIGGVQWKEGTDFYSFSYSENYKITNIASRLQQQKRIRAGNMWGCTIVLRNQDYIYFRNRRVIYYSSKKDFYNSDDSVKILSIILDSNNSTIYAFNKNELNEIWSSTVSNVYKLVNNVPIRQHQFKNVTFREFIFLNKTLVGITHQNQLIFCTKYGNQEIKIDSLLSNNCIWEKFYPINDSTTLIKTNNFFRLLIINPSLSKPKYSVRVIENPLIPFQPEYVFSDSSYIYFFKNREISSFPIDYVIEKKPLPAIKFSTLRTDKIENAIIDTVKLQYNQSKNLKISFIPVSFYHQNLSYEYNISEKGKPGTWTSFAGEELNLIKIGYGNFTIQVRAKTLSGDYSKAASFILIVQKPYWATWWFVSLIFIFLILIVAVLARFGIKQRLKKKEGEVRFLRSEYKALNALMNPHFIFNSLNSVQSLINNNENTTASKYIRIFSDLIRQNMRNIANDLIPLSKELDLVENYLKIEQLRFKEHLSYTIDIQDDIETEMIMVPPLLIQPLVENAIKHGIWPKKSNDGCIQIWIGEIGTELKIEIEDNGNGFNATKKTDTLHESYAMRNIEQRIEQLSQIHSTQINIEIIEKKDENGKVIGVVSTVTIQMPN